MIKTIHGTVEENWIDSNGHVNISVYTKLLDLSLENLSAMHNSINSLLPDNISFVVARILTVHISEMRFPCDWSINAGIFEINSKGFKSYHELVNGDRRVAKFYVLCSFFSLKQRKSYEIHSSRVDNFSFAVVKGILDPFNFTL